MPDTVEDALTVALWATNLAPPLGDLTDWVAGVDRAMAEARAEGADILLLPEYAAAQWLAYAPSDLPDDREIAWMAEQAPAALEALAPLPARHGLALLAGSMPWPTESPRPGDPPAVNRAWLLLPDGRQIAQDKLCLTPGERDPAAWSLDVGRTLTIVPWRGLRLVTLICLDVELPALAQALAPWQPDLVLVPSMTEKLSGHHRVHACARARAVELQTAVAVVGCIGDVATGRLPDGNTGGAAVYLPCEPALGHNGVLAEIPPAGEVDGSGPCLVSRIPLGTLRHLRTGAAEVWPGAWTAGDLRIVTAD